MKITRDLSSETYGASAPVYIALSWPWGRGCTTGDHPDVHAAVDAVAFASRAERDAWVGNGPAYISESGYREAWSSRDPAPYGWSRRGLRQSALERAWIEGTLD